jgi:hypothetical protein
MSKYASASVLTQASCEETALSTQPTLKRELFMLKRKMAIAALILALLAAGLGIARGVETGGFHAFADPIYPPIGPQK